MEDSAFCRRSKFPLRKKLGWEGFVAKFCDTEIQDEKKYIATKETSTD